MTVSIKNIFITSGEPASISTEITIKALISNQLDEKIQKILITDPSLVLEYKKKFFNQINVNVMQNHDLHEYKRNAINIIPIYLKEKSFYGKLNIKNCSFVTESISKSVELIKNNYGHAIVTNPINKFLMKSSGFQFEGHTEFLSSLCEQKKTPVMLLSSDKIKVIPLTTHIPISQISKKIKKKMIVEKIKIISTELHDYFDLKKARIFVSGLNPHSGDNGKIGVEEIKEIIPAIKQLKKEGFNVSGPYSADTMFRSKMMQKYDVAVCMFHDQALIPIKTLSFNNIVNITLGLDFIRTSPDHGTALDIAGLNIASSESIISAINLAEKFILKKV